MRPIRIAWSLERYHGIKTSDAIVCRICKRHGINRLPNQLPNRVDGRDSDTHRYENQLPGHPVEVDVKFLTLKRKRGGLMRRYQYTAIDDATRVRALKIYKRHTQANAIDFIDTVVDKFPFRIQTIRTDRGHEFQALPLSCHGQRQNMSTSSQGRHSSTGRSSARTAEFNMRVIVTARRSMLAASRAA